MGRYNLFVETKPPILFFSFPLLFFLFLLLWLWNVVVFVWTIKSDYQIWIYVRCVERKGSRDRYWDKPSPIFDMCVFVVKTMLSKLTTFLSTFLFSYFNIYIGLYLALLHLQILIYFISTINHFYIISFLFLTPIFFPSLMWHV